MPVYEYECKECANRFEKMQPITADPLKECPVCGHSALRRVFHPVGVIFKGSGWYITDNRNKNNSVQNTGEKQESGGKAESKSEAASGESPASSPSPASSGE